MPLYHEALGLAENPDVSGSGMRLATTRSAQQIRDELSRAFTAMSGSKLAEFASQEIKRAAAGPRVDGQEERDRASRDHALDLVTLVHPPELDHSAVRSLLAESIAACDAPDRAALAGPLESLQKAHPDDISVAIAVALTALGSNDPGQIEPALERLNALVAKTPLEAIPAGSRPNARQRAEALRQVSLWLVARACSNQSAPGVRATGERLAARAQEAAGRQPDSRWLLAMLREQGERALARGDRAQAEAIWARMLALVLAPDRSRLRPARPRPQAQPRPSPATATPSGEPPPLP